MLDAVAEKLFASLLDRCASFVGQEAKIPSLIAFLVSLTAVPLIARHFVWLGLAVFALGRLIGAIADRAGDNPLGPIYSSVALAALPFAFVLDAPVRALAAVFLMFAIAANSAVTIKFGRTPMAAVELLLVFFLAGLLPDWFGPIAYGGGGLCFIAAGIGASRGMA